MILGGLMKLSTIDYPDELACVVFTSGCNYDCYYCHNRQLIEGDVNLPEDEFFTFINSRIGILDGVVVSGGEPTIHDDLPDFLEKIKSLGFKVKLDSNGSKPEMIETLIQRNLVDYFAIDYKCEFSKYQQVCGRKADPRNIEKTIDILNKNTVAWELRTTIIPDIDIPSMLRMTTEIPTVPSYILKKYVPPSLYKEEDEGRIQRYHYEMIYFENIMDTLRSNQPNITIQ